MTPAPFLQDSAGPRQIVSDLPMTQRGPEEEAKFEAKSRTGSKCEDEMSELDDLRILLQISGQVTGEVPDTDDNDDGSKKYLVRMIVAMLVVILVVIVALYFICQNLRRKLSSTEANVEKTNDGSNPQYIYGHVGNYEQVNDEQSTYTCLKKPGEVIDDHLCAHLNEVAQNIYADQKETVF